MVASKQMYTEAIQSLQNFKWSRLLSMVKGSWLLIAILTSLMYSRRPLRNRSDKLYRQGWWFHWSVRGFFSQYTYVLTQYSRKHCRKWREQPNTITSNSSVTVVFKKKIAQIFSFVCCPSMCLYVLCSMLWCPLQFSHKTFGSFLPPVVLRRAYVAFTLFMCVYGGTQHILCCVFFVLCTICCQFVSVSSLHFWLSLRYSLMFII